MIKIPIYQRKYQRKIGPGFGLNLQCNCWWGGPQQGDTEPQDVFLSLARSAGFNKGERRTMLITNSWGNFKETHWTLRYPYYKLRAWLFLSFFAFVPQTEYFNTKQPVHRAQRLQYIGCTQVCRMRLRLVIGWDTWHLQAGTPQHLMESALVSWCWCK